VLPAVDSLKPGVDQTRLRILSATRELYASRGSRGTTTREVADRAGVNEATIFRHFGTKQQLLGAMLEHFGGVAEMASIYEKVVALPTIEEQLRALGIASIDAIKRKEDLIRVTMSEELVAPELHACAWRAPSKARQLLDDFFANKVEAGELHGDPAMLARVFMSLTFAFVMARRIWSDHPSTAEEAVSAIVALFLGGARGGK